MIPRLKKKSSHFFVKWSDMISDHLKSDHPILWKSVVHIKDWYVPKQNKKNKFSLKKWIYIAVGIISKIAAWLAAKNCHIIKWVLNGKTCFSNLALDMLRDRGIDDPDLPLNLGSKIRSRSQFKFGIGSDRNWSEVIEINRDREKIVDRQCTVWNK